MTHTLSSQSDRYTPQQIRHMDYISQFTTNIKHVKGSDNSAADALSRIGVSSFGEDRPPPIDFSRMGAAQRNDPELSKLQSSSTSLLLKDVALPMTDTTLICDMSTGTPHPFVPVDFRRSVFDSLHSLSHPGIRATQRLITTRYVWPDINKDVRRWTRSCL